MVISCGLIITCKGKVLLGHVHNKTFWDIPKGQLEDKEKYLECCLREVREEIGLDLYSVRNKFIDLGFFKFSKEKDLYLFKYECENFFDLNKLKCTSFYEEEGNIFPEIDFYKYVDFNVLYKYTNNKLGLLLSKILNIPLNYNQKEQIRRTICYILRHKLPLNKNGQVSLWLDKNKLYKDCLEVNPVLSVFSLDDFLNIINNDENNRFSICNDLIKANYGHSQEVEESNKEVFIPKDKLYHLTFSNCVDQILKDGLKPMTRHYVFLATKVEKAQDYKKKLKKIQIKNMDNSIEPILLEIDAQEAYKNGIKFFKEDDPSIICTNTIPAKYIKIKDNKVSINTDKYNLMVRIFNQK